MSPDRPHARAMLAGHELRNDLERARHLVAVAGEQVASGADPERCLATLAGIVDRAQATVAGMLLAADVTPRRTPTRVDTILERVVDTHDPDRARVSLRASSLLAHVDELMVERIADNLVANALEHTGAGTHVAVDMVLEDGGVRLAVADQGPGLPTEVADWLTRPLGTSDTDEEKPDPTGLAIVRRFAQAHDGRVEVAPGPGARIDVLLPGRSSR